MKEGPWKCAEREAGERRIRRGALAGRAALLPCAVAMVLLYACAPHAPLRTPLQPSTLLSRGHPAQSSRGRGGGAEERFAAQHPVYAGCAGEIDMAAFSREIAQKCGDMQTESACAAPCAEAMRSHARSFGCCFETILESYEDLDPPAAVDWRRWQGAVSGKCGVSFSDRACPGGSGAGLSGTGE
ncbi:hypothetical protein T484DRAFT_1891564, partial [Baffinella frigidus]